MITKNEFQKYEILKNSGLTNMLNLPEVSRLSGLERKTIIEIIDNYNLLSEKYN